MLRHANAQGLALAACVLVVEIAVVAYGLSLDALTPPTALLDQPDVLAPLKLPVAATTVVAQDQPGDAVTPIRAAVDDYLADPSRYETFINAPSKPAIARLPALKQLLDASHISDGRGPLADRIEKVVVYGESSTVLALQQIGMAAIKAGETLRNDDPNRAWDYFQAAFSLGARAFNERLSYREMNAGVTLMGTSAAWLGNVAEKTGRAAEAVRIVRFTDAFAPFVKSRLLPTVEAIYTFNEAKIGEHAGDVFAFATRSDERMWKLEAILKLGRMRYNVGLPGRPGDQRNAARLLESMESDDPVVQRAISLARGLTVEQFRTLR